MQYTKREHYFKYYSLAVYDNHDEDIKKFFRITNRFIDEVVCLFILRLYRKARF